jgi:hypothetical protein
MQGDYKHRLAELQRAHSIAGRARAVDCVKPEKGPGLSDGAKIPRRATVTLEKIDAVGMLEPGGRFDR